MEQEIVRRGTTVYYTDYPRPNKAKCDVQVTIRIADLIGVLGAKAAKNKSGRTQSLKGMIVVKRMSPPEPIQ